MAIVNETEILSILNSMNPWWKTGQVSHLHVQKFKRNPYYTCKQALESDLRRIVVLSGARRTGKTTIMYQIISELIEKGVNPLNIIFFTFDHPVIRMFGIEGLLRIYKNNISDSDDFYLFVDEVQFDQNWTHYLKIAYDFNPLMKAVATGSSSAVVESNLKESGAGRWTVIKVPTLSFYEYCKLKEVEVDIDQVKDVFKMHELTNIEQNQIILKLSSLQVHLKEYLQKGGFPELVKTDNYQYAQRLLRDDVLDRAIKSDIPSIYSVRSADELEKVFVYLCFNSSNVINVDAMSKEFEGVSKPTIEKYISYLEYANLINISKQLNISGKKILKRRNKIYISDTGIRNAVVLGSDIYTNDVELGYTLETAVYKHVKDYYQNQNSLFEVGYIRDNKGSEIDVIIQYMGKPIQFIEAKMRNHTNIKKDDGIVIYGLENTPSYVITKNATDYGIEERDNTKIYRIPAFAFLYLIGKETK